MTSSIVYGVVLTAFLFVLLAAFVWGHVTYKEEIEAAKFELFHLEHGRPAHEVPDQG